MKPFLYGKWIESATCAAYATPVFRRTFSCGHSVKKAYIRICGLGFYRLQINDAPVDTGLLSPAFSAYDKTVYYHEFNIRNALHGGENSVTVTLGNGWFHEPGEDSFDFEHAAWKHLPILFCEIIADGVCVCRSDTSWQCAEGRVKWNSVRQGEDCDFSCPAPVFTADAVISKGPGGLLKKQIAPPVKVQRRLPPVRREGNLFDFGENITGDVSLTLSGERGAVIRVLYGERLGEDGHIDQRWIKRHATIPRIQTDILTLSGGEDRWQSDFSYKGFRYVEIIGDCALHAIEAREFFTAFDEVGGFTCSDERLNQIDDAVRHSIRSNFLHIPTDCPHREKNGWTGDAHASCYQALFSFAMKDGYLSFLDALCDCQRENGELPCIAPTSVYGYNFQSGPTWDAALILIPWQIYLFDGEKSVLRRYYPHMKKYAAYLDTITENGICQSGLGDFLPHASVAVCPDGMMLSVYRLLILRTLTKIAGVLGDSAHVSRYAEGAAGTADAIRRTYIGHCDRTVSYLSTVLYAGLSPDREADAAALDHLIRARDYTAGDGLFSSAFLPLALSENGYFETAYRLVTNEKMPGYLYMLRDGSRTLWEHWDGTHGSLHHPMRSGVSRWLYESLAGIRLDEAHPGFAHVFIEPRFCRACTAFSVWHKTPHGILRVCYDRGQLALTIPNGTSATLILGDKRTEVTGNYTAKI